MACLIRARLPRGEPRLPGIARDPDVLASFVEDAAHFPGGDVLDVERGETRAHRDGYFDIELATRRVRVPVPRYRMPDVPKLSAGYFARPEMDLIDLFIGSEGTLGVITEITFRVLPERPARCLA